MKIYVGNLSFQTTEAELNSAFAAHGEVRSASLAMDRETGRPRGFGFIEIDDAAGAKAIDALNGSQLGGRQISVSVAKPKESRPTTGGGGRRW